MMNLPPRSLVAAMVLSGLLPMRVWAAEVPFLIARRSEPVRQAWDEINRLILENAQLASPLPDPLLARADLWASVGNHEEALYDYLDATKLTIANGASLAEQSRTLSRLTVALERLSRQPRPDHPFESRAAFSVGVRHFELKRPDLAEPFLAEAVRLAPDDPVYRAYRALALRELHQLELARRQMAVARSLLRDPVHEFDRRRLFNVRLERIQGAARQWITTEIDALSSAAQTSPVQEATELLRSHQPGHRVEQAVGNQS